MAQQLFDDRFTYANPGFSTDGWDSLSEQAIFQLYPEFAAVVGMVRRHSVVITKAKPLGIHDAITAHADPRIALILAGKKRKQDALPVFPTMQAVKEAMFGPPTDTSAQFENAERNIFVQGIRRVSAALAASTLIGTLAQINQQFEHAKHLEQMALKDLDSILAAADIVLDQTQIPSSTSEAQLEEKAFFFERLSSDIGADTLTVEVYLPAQTNAGWTSVGTYSGVINTSVIVGDITDTINQLSLGNNSVSNIVAAPIHASLGDQHRIEVSARSRDLSISYEVITIRIRRASGSLPPFRWGVDDTVVTQGTLNSALLRVQQGKVAAVSSSNVNSPKLENSGQPTVLYFRRFPISAGNSVIYEDGSLIPSGVWSVGNLSFRLSPYMDAPRTIPFPYKVQQPGNFTQDQLDSQRFSQIAELLLEEIFNLKSSSRTLGAIIRNDPVSDLRPLSGLELISFRLSPQETYSTLDILQLPRDIEMAIGDLTGPLTSFSNKSRSIRVKTQTETGSSISSVSSSGSYRYGLPDIVLMPTSKLMAAVSDRYNLLVPQATRLDGDDSFQELDTFYIPDVYK